MSVSAKPLINAQYASASGTNLYTAPASVKATIIDKFTAWNSGGSAQTLSVWLVPAGGSHDNSNLATVKSIGNGAGVDCTELQNQILNPGDSVFCLAGLITAISVRMSGREVT